MLGVNVSGNYASLKNLSPDNSNIQNQYQIYGGNLTVAAQPGAKTSTSFSSLVGLQGRLSFGKLDVSPSLNTGYLNFQKEGYKQTGSTLINGQTRQLDLISVEDQSSSGLIFKPQVKLGYNISQNIALFVAPAMLIGHELTLTVQHRVPLGGFNDRNTYETDQLAKGTWESKTSTSKFNFSEVNFGLSVALGKKKPKANAKPVGAVSSSYARTVSSSQQNKPDTVPAETVNPLYNAEGNAGQNPMHEKKGLVSTSKQTQGKTFGESMAGGLQAAGNNVANAAGKATMKEFTVTKKNEMVKIEGNDGGSTSEEDAAARRRVEVLKSNKLGDPHENLNKTAKSVVADEGGAGKVSVKDMTGPRAKELQGLDPVGKSISSKGVKRSEASVAMPGQPIGGIIVKGGKNPGGNMRLVSNGNGEVTLNNLTKGSYLFQLTGMEPAGKSISEKGLKRTEALAMAGPGNPIGGIIVKGGKNLGDNYINLTVNEKGQVGFDVLEAGDYKLIIQTPEAPNTGNQKGKKVEKATSGLKDTLKTQV